MLLQEHTECNKNIHTITPPVAQWQSRFFIRAGSLDRSQPGGPIFPEGSLCSKASDCESDQLGANPSPRIFLGT